MFESKGPHLLFNIGRCGSQAVAVHYGFEHEADLPGMFNVHRFARSGSRGCSSAFMYREVESMLSVIPDARCYHLVRDLRKTVKSHWRRWPYGEVAVHPNLRQHVPGFDHMDVFNKCLSYVAYWTIRIHAHGFQVVRLEDLKIPHVDNVQTSRPEAHWTNKHEAIFQRRLGHIHRHFGYE